MFRKAVSFGALLLLAGATVLVTPGLGQAQHGSGSDGGGHFSGGFHGGHVGGYSSLTPPNLGNQRDSPPATDNSAYVTLKVPPGARVFFGGAPTTSTGPVREYQSPPLTPGRQYTYEVQARWNENGPEVTQTQQVEVTAGAHVSAAFPIPSAQKR